MKLDKAIDRHKGMLYIDKEWTFCLHNIACYCFEKAQQLFLECENCEGEWINTKEYLGNCPTCNGKGQIHVDISGEHLNVITKILEELDQYKRVGIFDWSQLLRRWRRNVRAKRDKVEAHLRKKPEPINQDQTEEEKGAFALHDAVADLRNTEQWETELNQILGI